MPCFPAHFPGHPERKWRRLQFLCPSKYKNQKRVYTSVKLKKTKNQKTPYSVLCRNHHLSIKKKTQRLFTAELTGKNSHQSISPQTPPHPSAVYSPSCRMPSQGHFIKVQSLLSSNIPFVMPLLQKKYRDLSSPKKCSEKCKYATFGKKKKTYFTISCLPPLNFSKAQNLYQSNKHWASSKEFTPLKWLCLQKHHQSPVLE